MNTQFYFDNMKRIIILSLLCVAALAACTVDELSVAFDEPTRNSEGTIIDNYPYIWKHTYRTSTSKVPHLEFKTFDCTLPLFDNGGKVIVGNINGGITCLETNSGNEVWTCVLLEDTKYVADCAIIDYIIASTEEWIIINLGGFYFVKIDLKTGKKLGVCEPQSMATFRMIKDGDERFFVTVKEQVYCVTTDNMTYKPFSFNGEFYSNRKIYPFPYIKDNEKYYFVEIVSKVMTTLTKSDGTTEEYPMYYESLCIINALGDTIFKTKLTNLADKRSPSSVPILISYITEYNGNIYMFTNQGSTYAHDIYIFNWESMNIVHHAEFYARPIDAKPEYASLAYQIRYHQFCNDNLFLHINKSEQRRFDNNDKETHTESIVCYGCHIYENNIYIPHENYLKIRDYNTKKMLANIPINEYDFADSSNDTPNVYEHVIGKNSANETIIVIITDNDIVCYAGL